MKKYIYSNIRPILVLLITCTVLLAACSKGRQQQTNAQPVYSEDSAMAHYLVHPDRAITLLDSAAIVGNLTAQRAEYLKAIVVLSAKQAPDSCIRMCQRMIDNKAWTALPDSEDVVSFQVDLYRLMANAAHSVGNLSAVVRNAREGVKLAHGVDKLRGDEADMLSRMGLILCQTGQPDEGFEAMQRAEQLALTDNTWSSLLSYLNNAKKMYYAYDHLHQTDEAKKVVDKALARLDQLRQDIGDVKNAPDAMVNDKAALEEFIQFYQASLYSYLVSIYVKCEKPDSAQYWLRHVAENPMAKDPSITQALTYPLIKMGMYDEARLHIEDMKAFLADDTLSEDYLVLLQYELLAELHSNSNDKNLLQLTERIFSLDDSLRVENQRMTLAEATTQYRLQDERMRRIDAEDTLLLIITTIVVVLSVIILVAAVIYIRRLRSKDKTLRTQLEQAEEELEIMKEIQKEDMGKTNDATPEEIYARAIQIMEARQPYKDPKFDISTLATEVQTNRLYLSGAINNISGMNFRSWLAKYRVERAKSVLLQKPDIKNDMLADECGFDNRVSLYRQFKNFEGLTPGEWIKKNKGK